MSFPYITPDGVVFSTYSSIPAGWGLLGPGHTEHTTLPCQPPLLLAAPSLFPFCFLHPSMSCYHPLANVPWLITCLPAGAFCSFFWPRRLSFPADADHICAFHSDAAVLPL